jgi:hypothetical protein
MADFWRVAPEWAGETCFIVAGGPSVLDLDLRSLQGRRVIAINSSWSRVPFADLLFFGDARWWHHYRDEVLTSFSGRIATAARGIAHPRVLRLRATSDGFSREPDTVALRRTSTTAAINLAVHLGVVRIVLLGVDNKIDANGLTHHHAPHPWDLRCDWDRQQRDDFANISIALRSLGVDVINASAHSAVDCWPRLSFDEAAE